MSDDFQADDQQEYGLVMPFICTTPDGPYDSKAFVAGCTMERAACILEYQQPDEHQVYVPPELVAQLDLVAMRFGYSLTQEPWDEHPDEWTLATFTKQITQDAAGSES